MKENKKDLGQEITSSTAELNRYENIINGLEKRNVADVENVGDEEEAFSNEEAINERFAKIDVLKKQIDTLTYSLSLKRRLMLGFLTPNDVQKLNKTDHKLQDLLDSSEVPVHLKKDFRNRLKAISILKKEQELLMLEIEDLIFEKEENINEALTGNFDLMIDDLQRKEKIFIENGGKSDESDFAQFKKYLKKQSEHIGSKRDFDFNDCFEIAVRNTKDFHQQLVEESCFDLINDRFVDNRLCDHVREYYSEALDVKKDDVIEINKWLRTPDSK